MGKRKPALLPLDEASARWVAEIIGPHSAAARALKEMEGRRARGEDVRLYEAPGTIIVGPSIRA